MNNVAELKRYAAAHASTHGLDGYEQLLDRIESDDHDKPGSWVHEWCAAGRLMESQGRDLDASRFYTMARFPYVDGPARQETMERGIRAMERWRSGQPIQSLRHDLPDGQVRCWTTGLTPGGRRPLLVIMGGIVTPKEQWAPILLRVRRLGMAGLVAELPGIGENTLRYGPTSWRMLSNLLDAIADHADVSRTYAMALSFSGHLAMRCALEDSRIRGIITMGAPVSEFFTDSTWQRNLPKLTVDTLGHLTGSTPDELIGGLSDWALSPKELAGLDIPVSYAASTRDEIIPAGEIELLRDHVSQLDLIEHDDVHGSPSHQAETRLWMIHSLLRTSGVRGPQSALVNLLLRGARRKAARAR